MKIIRKITNDLPLFLSIILFFLLLPFSIDDIPRIPQFIDWHTIYILTILIIISSSLQYSNLFERIIYRILKITGKERTLSLTLVLSSALLSMIITNDIALFIVIPITLHLKNLLEKGTMEKLIIMETIAVNVGSLLTPIGNPQNLYLWQKWDLSFFQFCKEMLPLSIISLALLIIFSLIIFPNKPIKKPPAEKPQYNKFYAHYSIFLLLFFIIVSETGIPDIFIFPLVLILFFFNRQFLKNTDFSIIFLFIIIFIDIGFLENTLIFDLFSKGIKSIHNILYESIILSQIIGNVPASLIMANLSSNYKSIAIGTNIAGNGLIIASFANIIGIRFLKNKQSYLKFHYYSIPFFIISLVVYVVIIK